jgi:hypothetical protein
MFTGYRHENFVVMQSVWRFLVIAALGALSTACGGGTSSTNPSTPAKNLSLIWDQGNWDTNQWN